MIDLHLHTTASDGRSEPEALAAEAAAAGVSVVGVTDHDTTSAIAAVTAAGRAVGLTVIPGIEITAVEDGLDVHVLGYFIDPGHMELQSFLDRQRADRRRRLEDMVDRLARLDIRLDAGFLQATRDRRSSGRAVGRPLLARALVAGGHARDVSDAFDRYLAEGRPAFAARTGAGVEAVAALIGRAGGIASLAHAGKLGRDDLVRQWAQRRAIPAIEVYHPDHDAADRERYLALADDSGLLVTGGSDYHGPGSGRDSHLGRVGLPVADYARLAAGAAVTR